MVFTENLSNEQVEVWKTPNCRGNLTNTVFDPVEEEKGRETITLVKPENLDKLPNGRIVLKEENTGYKRQKIDPDELKSEIFDMFENDPKLTLDGIIEEVDQPRQYVLEILSQIAERKKERNKQVWVLKTEYMSHAFDDDEDFNAKKKAKLS